MDTVISGKTQSMCTMLVHFSSFASLLFTAISILCYVVLCYAVPHALYCFCDVCAIILSLKSQRSAHRQPPRLRKRNKGWPGCTALACLLIYDAGWLVHGENCTHSFCMMRWCELQYLLICWLVVDFWLTCEYRRCSIFWLSI